MVSFDDVLEKRIGTGFYQIRTILIIGLVEICDAIEYQFMSILMSILKKEWNLSKDQISALSSSFLLGILLGNVLFAFIADYIGRKVTFTFFSALSVFLIYYTSFSQSYNEIIVLRLCFGLVFGTTNPLSTIFIIEITEAKYRGRYQYCLTLLYIFGKMYFTCLCFLFLDDYTSGNWRGLMRFNGLPIALAFVLSLFFLKETVRYSLSREQFEIAFEEIENMMKINNQQQQLTDEEKHELILWSRTQKEQQQEQELHVYGIFSKEYIKITISLWILYILTNIQNMSIYLLMPFLFAQNNEGFDSMLYMFLAEFLFALLIYQIIDNPSYGGRLKIIGYSICALIVSNTGLYIYRDKFLFLGLLIVKLATRGLFATLNISCCECYALQVRSQGTGMAQAIGKFAAIPYPFIVFPLFEIDPYLPFGVMTVLSIIMLIVECFFKQDKTQKHLETLKDD